MRSKKKFGIAELESDEMRLKGRISRLKEELEVTQALIHLHYRDATGLVGRLARSDRVSCGIVIDEVNFKTWDRKDPQSVSGRRLTTGSYVTIPVTSQGYEVFDHEPDPESPGSQPLSLPG